MAKIFNWNEADIIYQQRVNNRVMGGNGSQQGPGKRRRNPGSPPAKSSNFITAWLIKQVPAAITVVTGPQSGHGALPGAAADAAYEMEDDGTGTGRYIYKLDDTIAGSDKRVKIAVVNPNPYIAGEAATASEPILITGLKASVSLTGETKRAIILPSFDLFIFPGADKTKTQALYRVAASRENRVGGRQCN